MTVLAELRAEVYKTWQSSPAQTVLWLDPQREWERLLDQLATELELIKYEGSQLELWVKIELESAQKPRIVYVPLPQPGSVRAQGIRICAACVGRRFASRPATLGHRD